MDRTARAPTSCGWSRARLDGEELPRSGAAGASRVAPSSDSSDIKKGRIRRGQCKRIRAIFGASAASTLRGVSARHLAIYTGSFDPPTHGHLDVLARARTLFDEIVVGVGRNPDKVELFTPEERVGLLAPLVRQLVATDPSGAACSVDRYSGLTVDFARSRGAVAIIRGIRNVTDLAAECQFAITNRQVAGIETVFVVTGESHAFLSSSLIRQIAGFGGSLDALSRFVPPNVAEAMRVKMEDPRHPLARLARESQAD